MAGMGAPKRRRDETTKGHKVTGVLQTLRKTFGADQSDRTAASKPAAVIEQLRALAESRDQARALVATEEERIESLEVALKKAQKEKIDALTAARLEAGQCAAPPAGAAAITVGCGSSYGNAVCGAAGGRCR